MGKLFDTFNKIERGRQMCVEALNNKNIETPADASLNTIAEKIKGTYVGPTNFINENHIWTRPQEWINTEEIFLNAPEVEGCVPFVLYLLQDNRDSITVRLTSPHRKQSQVCAHTYYMSDGTFMKYVDEDTTNYMDFTHTWDKSKDIKFSLKMTFCGILLYRNF